MGFLDIAFSSLTEKRIRSHHARQTDAGIKNLTEGLTSNSYSDCNKRRKHSRYVSNKMHLAARYIEPIDWHLNDFRADTSQSDKKLDVERESLHTKFAPNRFVAFAPYQLETTL
jgi:hypothetical protein